PAIPTPLVQSPGTAGLLALLIPTGLIATLLAGRLGPAVAATHAPRAGQPDREGRDDWRAFGILSGAIIARSIVFYGLNTFLALFFMSRWHQTAAEASWAS